MVHFFNPFNVGRKKAFRKRDLQNVQRIPIKSDKSEIKVNQKHNMMTAPTRYKHIHKSPVFTDTADRRFIKEMKAKYGSNINAWPTTDKRKETTPSPARTFNLKVRRD